ncbi:endonuclease/exonuclease/phosphatase family protein [Trueperella sp. LYQ143]|uniref:endonuclease/exonuclease/phosphatase family protein n=1 Tax=Trueperella sp. LYQ143 TaxID=3391059 RepID=UPI0039837081
MLRRAHEGEENPINPTTRSNGRYSQRRGMKYVWGILAVCVITLMAVTIRPDVCALTAHIVVLAPWANIIALRGWLVIVFGVLGLLCAILAAIRWAVCRKGRIAVGLAVILGGCALAHGVLIGARGIANPGQLPLDTGITASGQGTGAITVLSYNTQGGRIDVTALREVVKENGVDLLVLPETSTKRGKEINAALAEAGMEFQQFDTATDQYQPDFRSTVVLVSAALGQYTHVDSGLPQESAVRIVPVNGSGPTIYAVHTFAPSPATIDIWRSHIRQVYALCDQPGPYIIAGDFNSTKDHELAVGANCFDAMAEAGSAGLGTWPSTLPPLLGAPIDRVLHDDSYQGVAATLIGVGESDHRGIIVRLEPRSQ